jgi:hypothetical protein
MCTISSGRICGPKRPGPALPRAEDQDVICPGVSGRLREKPDVEETGHLFFSYGPNPVTSMALVVLMYNSNKVVKDTHLS